MGFNQVLKQIRSRKGFSSGKSFYEFLSNKILISFNYSYYTKLESGKATPSAAVVNEICSQLKKGEARILIASYCESLFPNYSDIFKASPDHKEENLNFTQEKTQEQRDSAIKQNELTLKQVFQLSETFEHYIVFMVLSLSRVSISVDYLDRFLEIDSRSILEDLSREKIVSFNGEIASYSAIEQRFPSVMSDRRLKEIYTTLDQWDKKIQEFLNFNENKKKFFIRRTSKTHISILNGLLDQLDNIVKISDEIDNNLNDEVMVIEYRMSSGKMPG